MKPEISDVNGIACTRHEVEALVTMLQAEQIEQGRRQQLIARVTGASESGVADVVRLREGGFSESKIGEWVAGQRQKLSAAGVTKAEIDAYFGGDPYARVDSDAAILAQRQIQPAATDASVAAASAGNAPNATPAANSR